MLLYSAKCHEFYDDIASQTIADKISAAFKVQMGREAPPGEKRAWHNSLTSLHFAAQRAGLSEQGVIVEYELPMTSRRLDVMFTGADSAGKDSATVIELKQWEQCETADGDNVVTWVGGNYRDVLHPSIQVGQYLSYLENGQSVFHEGSDPVRASASAYLHNYKYILGDPLLDDKFLDARERCPIFTKEDQDKLVTDLGMKVGGGPGNSVLERVLESQARPSKKLMQNVASMLDGKDEYVLLDEQLVAFDRVLTEAKRALAQDEASTVLIIGGPGTGKSVIALNLMAHLSSDDHNVQHATGSKAFTETLRQVVGRDAAQQFRYFNNFALADAESIDVLICDEAHRIRATSVSRFTPKDKRSGKTQIEELNDVAKVNVFFVDDLQIVRHGEVGSADLIRESAKGSGRRFFEYKLAAQFRCAGSEGFVSWVTNTLGIEDTANRHWSTGEEFDFQIADSPEQLEAMIRGKVEEGVSARLMAGYCWPWSGPKGDGTLEDDVQIGDFAMPWNARPDAGRLASGIPKSNLWASEPGGIDQIGCVYTAQGFEFDYAGVIIGPDLVYREGEGWIGQLTESNDRQAKMGKESFTERIKNTYRVLLTRGMKGCYVYFTDDETREYWASRIITPGS